jgi:hypothetical protein
MCYLSFDQPWVYDGRAGYRYNSTAVFFYRQRSADLRHWCHHMHVFPDLVHENQFWMAIRARSPGARQEAQPKFFKQKNMGTAGKQRGHRKGAWPIGHTEKGPKVAAETLMGNRLRPGRLGRDAITHMIAAQRCHSAAGGKAFGTTNASGSFVPLRRFAFCALSLSINFKVTAPPCQNYSSFYVDIGKDELNGINSGGITVVTAWAQLGTILYDCFNIGLVKYWTKDGVTFCFHYSLMPLRCLPNLLIQRCRQSTIQYQDVVNAKRSNAWHDIFVLTFSLEQWLLQTGIHPHPGPELLRRVTGKQTRSEFDDLPGEGLSQLDGQNIAEWEHLVDDYTKHQTPPWDLSKGFLFEGKNVTSFLAHENGLVTRVARLSLLQEHSIPEYDIPQVRGRVATDHGRKLIVGPPDPNNQHNAGVGAIAAAIDTLFEFQSITDEFSKAKATGRAIHLGYSMGKAGMLFSFFVVYGHSGGAQSTKKAMHTSAILSACVNEAQHYPDNPKFLVGDLNGEFTTFPELQVLCQTMGWQDLNAVADTWGGTPNQPTCTTALSNQPTIRDYCFACPLAFPMVKHFRVIDDDLCPVHSTLQIQVIPDDADRWVHKACHKLPLSELVDDHFLNIYGDPPPEAPNSLEQDAETLRGACDALDEHVSEENVTQIHPFLQKAANEAARRAKAHYEELKLKHLNSMKTYMDFAIGAKEFKLMRHLEHHDLTAFWSLLWQVVEDAVANFTNNGGNQKAASYKGRGLPPTKLEKQTMPRANASGNDYALHSPTWLNTISNHMNRCRCLADYLAIIARGKVEGAKKEDVMKKCNDCKAKIIKFLEWQAMHPDEFWLPKEHEAPQDAPRTPQDSPRWPLDAPMTPQDASRTPQDAPRWPQDAPMTPQESPCWPQDAPRCPQDAPFWAPKTHAGAGRLLRHGSAPEKMAPQDAPRTPKSQDTSIYFNPESLKDKLNMHNSSFYARIFALKKEIKRYATFISRWQSHFSRQTERDRHQRFIEMQRSMGAMCRALKGPCSAPLSRLALPANDGKEGGIKITSDPAIIDSSLQGIWGKIHEGNLGEETMKQAGKAFLQKFGDFFVKQPEFVIQPISPTDLKGAIDASPDNANGLDGVAASDLRILSDKAVHLIALMFAKVEAGAQWPKQMLKGRTAWLDKTEGPLPSIDPLDYRGLAILSKVYRIYAIIRLRHLAGWIQGWEKEQLFAGTTAPCGAEDAWYTMGVDLELARLFNHIITGGSADIWKCFDQMQRMLLYFLLEAGGFPMPILTAYKSFHENILYHNTIGRALGAPHKKKCSIPQGCPFSMMLTGFSFHPWVALMRSYDVIPRALADDLTIIAIGPGHERRFRDAYDMTFLYLHHLGAKPAPKKCYTYSTSGETRQRLRMHYWQQIQAHVEVVLEARDLGGHISMSHRLGGATSAKRIARATALAVKLRFFPWNWEAKRKIAQTLIFPTALYASEATPLKDDDLAKLDVAVAKAVGPYSHGSSIALSGMLNVAGCVLHSTFQVLLRTLSLFRRMLVKHPGLHSKISIIMNKYVELQKPGILGHGQQPKPKDPAPPPGQASRAQWMHSDTTKGPIGLMISRLHCIGGYVNLDLVVKSSYYTSFDILNCALQHLRRHVGDVCTIALTHSIKQTRTMYAATGVIDLEAYHRSMAKLDANGRDRLLRLHLQAHWTDAQQDACYISERKAICPHCGSKAASILHLWSCKGLQAFRTNFDPDIAHLNEHNTPAHILIGIPEKLQVGNTGWLCNQICAKGDVYAGADAILRHKCKLSFDTEKLIDGYCPKDANYDTQQLAYKHLATQGRTTVPTIAFVDGSAPDRPNVATDGSLKEPKQHLAIGTFGSWEWDRSTHHLTPEELAFCRPLRRQDEDLCGGILLAGTLPGVYNSSARTEIAGIITALAKPIPIHIILDNKGVVDRISAMIRNQWYHRKPWELLPDGDLWRVVEETLKYRGSQSTRVSWVKGHAPWSRILQERNCSNYIANGQADYAADQGAQAVHLQDVQKVLSFHAAKQDAHEKIIARLQRLASALLEEDRSIRQRDGILDEGRAAQQEITSIPSIVIRRDFSEGEPMQLHPLPPDLSSNAIPEHNKRNSSFDMLHMFWSNLRWRLDAEAKPTTWLELFIVFRIMGGGNRQEDMNLPKPKLQSSLRQFKSASKALFKHVGNTNVTLHMQTYKGKEFILQPYGLRMHQQAVQAELCLNDVINTRLHEYLAQLKLIKHGTNKGKLRTCSGPLPKHEPWFQDLFSRPPAIINLLQNKIDRCNNGINHFGEKGDGRDLKPQSFCLKCPHCSSSRECAHIILYSTHARVINCPACKRNTTSTQWLCPHSVQWHRCHEHREGGMRCGRRRCRNNPQDKAIRDRGKGSMYSLRRFKRLKRLGNLGEAPAANNSTKGGAHILKVRKKNKKKVPSGIGENAQTPNGESPPLADAWIYRGHLQGVLVGLYL